MSASQRRKGSGGEREVCALLSDVLGTKVTRNITQARDGGADILLRPYAIEVKRRAKIGGLYDWMKQATDSRSGIPVVACRADGGDWLAVMRLTDWIAAIREETVAEVAA